MVNSVNLGKDEIKDLGKLLFSLISEAMDSLNSELNGAFTIDRFSFHTYSKDNIELINTLEPKSGSQGIYLLLEGIFNGSYLLTFEETCVLEIVESIAGKEFVEIMGAKGAIKDVLGEIGNITASKIIGKLTNILGAKNTYTVPEVYDVAFPLFVQKVMGEESECMAVLDVAIKDLNLGRKGHILIFFIFPNETELHQTFTFLHERIPTEAEDPGVLPN